MPNDKKKIKIEVLIEKWFNKLKFSTSALSRIANTTHS